MGLRAMSASANSGEYRRYAEVARELAKQQLGALGYGQRRKPTEPAEMKSLKDDDALCHHSRSAPPWQPFAQLLCPIAPKAGPT
jgi:hypothetical protein